MAVIVFCTSIGTTGLWDQTPPGFSIHFIECLRDCYFKQRSLNVMRGRGHDTPSLLDLIITPNVTTIDNLEYCSALEKIDNCALPFSLVCENYQRKDLLRQD